MGNENARPVRNTPLKKSREQQPGPESPPPPLQAEQEHAQLPQTQQFMLGRKAAKAATAEDKLARIREEKSLVQRNDGIRTREEKTAAQRDTSGVKISSWDGGIAIDVVKSAPLSLQDKRERKTTALLMMIYLIMSRQERRRQLFYAMTNWYAKTKLHRAQAASQSPALTTRKVHRKDAIVRKDTTVVSAKDIMRDTRVRWLLMTIMANMSRLDRRLQLYKGFVKWCEATELARLRGVNTFLSLARAHISDLEGKNTSLANQLDSVRSMLTDTNSRLGRSVLTIARLKEEKVNSPMSLGATADAALRNLRITNYQIETQKEALKSENARLERDLAGMNIKVMHLGGEISSLTTKNRILDTENKSIVSTKKQADKAKAKLDVEVVCLRQSQKNLEDKVSALTKTVASLEEEKKSWHAQQEKNIVDARVPHAALEGGESTVVPPLLPSTSKPTVVPTLTPSSILIPTSSPMSTPTSIMPEDPFVDKLFFVPKGLFADEDEGVLEKGGEVLNIVNALKTVNVVLGNDSELPKNGSGKERSSEERSSEERSTTALHDQSRNTSRSSVPDLWTTSAIKEQQRSASVSEERSSERTFLEPKNLGPPPGFEKAKPSISLSHLHSGADSLACSPVAGNVRIGIGIGGLHTHVVDDKAKRPHALQQEWSAFHEWESKRKLYAEESKNVVISPMRTANNTPTNADTPTHIPHTHTYTTDHTNTVYSPTTVLAAERTFFGAGSFALGGDVPSPPPLHVQQDLRERMFSGPERMFSGPEKVFSGPERMFSGPEKMFSGPERVFSEPERMFSGPERMFAREEPMPFVSELPVFGQYAGGRIPQQPMLSHMQPPQQPMSHMHLERMFFKEEGKSPTEERTHASALFGGSPSHTAKHVTTTTTDSPSKVTPQPIISRQNGVRKSYYMPPDPLGANICKRFYYDGYCRWEMACRYMHIESPYPVVSFRDDVRPKAYVPPEHEHVCVQLFEMEECFQGNNCKYVHPYNIEALRREYAGLLPDKAQR